MAEWEPERPCSYEGKEEPPARRPDSLGHQPDPTWEPPCVVSPYPPKGLFVCQALTTSSPMVPTGPCTHTRTYAHCTLGHTQEHICMTYIQRHSPFFNLMAELPPSITLSPQTLTPRPAPAALPSWSSEWGWGWALGQCGFWKAPLTPLIPSPPPGVAGLGVPARRGMRVKMALKGRPALHEGPWLGVGGGSSTHPAGVQSQMEARWALQKVSGHSAEEQSAPTPQGPSPDSETQTLRGAGGHTDQV